MNTKTMAAVCCAVLVAAVFSSAWGQTFDYKVGGKTHKGEYVLGTKILQIPKTPKPARGAVYVDPVFHTRVVRITDSADGYKRKMVPFYCRHDIENADGTKIIRVGDGAFYLYDIKKYRKIKKLKFKTLTPECRWDRKNPDVFYYHTGTRLFKYDITDDSSTLVRDFGKDFPGATKILNAAEGTASFDGRYWAFMAVKGSRRKPALAFVCYDMKENKIAGKKTDTSRIDHISMTMSGRYVLAPLRTNKGGISFFSRDFSKVVTSGAGVTHSDICLDTEGKECLANAGGMGDWYIKVDADTGRKTKLISFVHETTWAKYKAECGGVHFSGNSVATPGWVTVSTYDTKTGSASAWMHGSIYLLELKEKPRIWRVVHHRSVKGGYWSSTATINTAGTRIYWGSNWNNPGGPIDTYVVELPPAWHEDLMGRAKSKNLREKAAKLLGVEVKDLMTQLKGRK